MMNRPNSADLKSKAQADLDSGRRELLKDLKRCPASELHVIEPALLARLTPEQRAELFAKNVRKFQYTSGPRQAIRPPRRLGRTSLLRRTWSGLPLFVRSQVLGLLSACLFAGAATVGLAHEDELAAIIFRPKTLPVKVYAWPGCRRLTRFSDGCVYTVATALSWQAAAAALGMNLSELFDGNPHLATHAPLQRGDRLVVWRGHIPLEN